MRQVYRATGSSTGLSSDWGARQTDQYSITNESQSVVDTHLLIIVKGLSNGFQMENASGSTRGVDPDVRVFCPMAYSNPGRAPYRR
jgi:hypothetical protein